MYTSLSLKKLYEAKDILFDFVLRKFPYEKRTKLSIFLKLFNFVYGRKDEIHLEKNYFVMGKVYTAKKIKINYSLGEFGLL